MANVAEYIIKFKDQFGNVINKAESDLKRLDTATSSASTSFGRLGTAITGALSIAAIGAFSRSTVNLAADIEQMGIQFEVLSGSAEKGQRLLSDLKKFAVESPFDTKSLASASQTMLNFGINIEDVLENAKVLGEVAGGDKERFKSLALAFSQSAAAGKLMGQDLLQMINAGFSPLQEIYRKTGESITSLRERMSEGTLSFEEVRGAFRSATEEGGRFNGLLERLKNTFSGQRNILIGEFQLLQETIGKALIPTVSVFIEKLSGMNQWALRNAGAIESFGKALKNSLPYIISTVKYSTYFFIGIKALPVIINAIAVAKKAWGLATVLLNRGLLSSITLIKGFRMALMSTGVGALTIGIGILIEKLISWRAKTNQQTQAQSLLNKSLEETNNLIRRREYNQFLRDIGAVRDTIKSIGGQNIPIIEFDTADDMIKKFQSNISKLSESQLQGFSQFFQDEIVTLKKSLRDTSDDLTSSVIKSNIAELNKQLSIIEGELKFIEKLRAKTSTNSRVNQPVALDSKSEKTLNKVTGAAPKVFNININKLVENFEVSTSIVKETPSMVKDMILGAIQEALVDVQLMPT